MPKGPNLVVFGIITTVTIFVWIGFEVYKILNPRTIESIPDSVLMPISPTLDLETLRKLEARRNFTDEQISPLKNFSPTPTLQKSEESIATDSAQSQ